MEAMAISMEDFWPARQPQMEDFFPEGMQIPRPLPLMGRYADLRRIPEVLDLARSVGDGIDAARQLALLADFCISATKAFGCGDHGRRPEGGHVTNYKGAL